MPATLTFTSFDWFLVVIVVVSALMALRRGIVRVLFSLAGLVAGIVLASWNFPQLAILLERWISSSVVADLIAFLLILAVVIAIFSFLASSARRGVKAAGLGVADSLLGGLFGLVRGGLLAAALMMTLVAFVPDSFVYRNSVLAPYFLGAAHAVSFVLPQHLQKQISSGATHLLQHTPDLSDPSLETQHP